MLDDKRLELMKDTAKKANEAHQTKLRIAAEYKSVIKAGGERALVHGIKTISSASIAELKVKAQTLADTLIKEEEEAENQVRAVAEHEEQVSRLSLS